MAIEWGGWSGHMRVGIDVWTDNYDTNTPSINIYIATWIQIDSSWSFNDAQTMNYSGSIGGSTNYQNNLGANQTYQVSTLTIYNQGQSYGGGPTYTFGASVSGHYQGATPGHTRYFTLPAKPANVPTAPGIGVDSVTSTSARVLVYAPDPRGSNIEEYQTAISLPGPDWGAWTTSFGGGTGTATGLSPATTYQAATRARNGVGWSAWAYSGNFTTGATVPGTPVLSAPSNVGQTTADLSWTTPSNGGSAITDYTVQIATDSGFTQGVQNLTFPSSPSTLTNLVPGTQYWARVRANNGVGAGSYTAAQSFTTLAGTPSIITPAPASVQTDGIARVVLSALGIAADRTITAQFSQDGTFATGVKTVTLNPTGRSSNDQYTLSNPAEYLKTGTWFVRSRVTNNTSGYITPWSTTVEYTQSHIPSASIQSPTAGQVAAYQAQVPFTWRFTDAAHPNDNQTSYRLVIENNATGEVIYDSAKTALVSSGGDAIMTRTVAIATSLKNVQLRWRVMVWDKGDSASAWTGYSLFSLSDPPVVTVTTPSAILPVTTGAPTFAWNISIPSGGVQASAVIEVREQGTNTLVWQETITGQTRSVTPAVVVLRNQQAYYYTLVVTDSTGLSSTATGEFTTSYSAPNSVPYTIDGSSAEDLGYVLVQWTEADPDDLFAYWKIYRRTLATQWELVTTITNQNTREYRDYMLLAGESYSYSVTQVATRSGVLLESTVGYYRDTNNIEQPEHRYAVTDLTNYWIINPDNPDLSVRLPIVVSDDSTLEFEDATYNIIGRGRHKDYGDELGYSGTLNFQIRGFERPNPVRLQIEALRRAKETYYLRTPFGRLFPIALGNISWTPIAGTGVAEMGDMSIPYEEVH